jgi:hypothetical protein
MWTTYPDGEPAGWTEASAAPADELARPPALKRLPNADRRVDEPEAHGRAEPSSTDYRAALGSDEHRYVTESRRRSDEAAAHALDNLQVYGAGVAVVGSLATLVASSSAPTATRSPSRARRSRSSPAACSPRSASRAASAARRRSRGRER